MPFIGRNVDVRPFCPVFGVTQGFLPMQGLITALKSTKDKRAVFIRY